MSQIKLKHSGGNSVIIAAPDSNPASDRTLKLPSDADGTILTTTNPKAGNIIQVVQAVKTDTQSFSAANFADITGLSAAITPSSSSNKILVTAHVYLAVSGSGDTTKLNFVRGSTNIGQPSGSVSQTGTVMAYVAAVWMFPVSMNFLDSPSTTSATTYKVQLGKDGASNTTYVNRYNGADNYHGISTLTLMEVAA